MKVAVLGNGRTLKDFKFNKIRSDTIGMCLAFREWERINWYPTHYVCVDHVVLKSNINDINKLIEEKKCKSFLISNSIKDKLISEEGVYYIEDFQNDINNPFNKLYKWCSGSSAVLYAIYLGYLNIDILGIDCNYVEFVPEAKLLVDGTLKIVRTPTNNPNYFIDDYQREGDIYNKPNLDTVHMPSWDILYNIIKNNYPSRDLNVFTNNNVIGLSKYYKKKDIFNYIQNKKEIAFLVPTTSNKRLWNNFRDTYLNQILLPSITKLSGSFDIILYIGYDHDDRLYSNISLPDTYDNIKLKWYPFDSSYKGKPTHIWNDLAKFAINDNIEYLQIGGDDISYDKRSDWLGRFIKLLNKKNNIGYAAGYSNNDNIPTQFLLHKKHIDIFEFIYPPQIEAWFCDDWMYEIYSKIGIWEKEYKHFNLGGEPRYTPKNDKKLCNMLVKRYKPTLNRYLNK